MAFKPQPLTIFSVFIIQFKILISHPQELAFFQLNPGHLPDGIASPQQRHVRPRPPGVHPEKTQKAKDFDIVVYNKRLLKNWPFYVTSKRPN